MPRPPVDPMIITWGVDRQRHYIENMEARIEELEKRLEALSQPSPDKKPAEGKPLKQVFAEEAAKEQHPNRRLNKRGHPYHYGDCPRKGVYSKTEGCAKCDG